MDDCVFCSIISGAVPSQRVYEDENTFAFLDINPNNPGHTLVVPKEHTRDIFSISREQWAAVMETTRILAPIIRDAVEADGINITMNNRRVAGQLVDHVHIHIIPRHEGDGFTHWSGTPYADGEAAATAEKIAAIVHERT